MAAKHFALAMWPFGSLVLVWVAMLSASGLIASVLEPYGVGLLSAVFLVWAIVGLAIAAAQSLFRVPDWLTWRLSRSEMALNALMCLCLGLALAEGIHPTLRFGIVPTSFGAAGMSWWLRYKREAKERELGEPRRD